MVWDDYYGKQNNPYTANDFRIILRALKAQVPTYHLIATEEEREALFSLIERTEEALEIEES